MKCWNLHCTRDENSNRSFVDRLSQHHVLVLVLILLLTFGIRVIRLDFHSLWYDEATTVYLLQDKPLSEAFDAILGTSGSETLHPLYYLVLSAWMQVAGSSERALRFPSVVFGSCAAVVYALLLYQVGGMKTVAFGLLLILSPFLMWYSRDARPYALVMFLTGLHLLLYLKILGALKSKKLSVGFIVTGALMIYSGILVGMLLLAEFVWSLVVRRKACETVAIAVIMLLALPLVWHGWRTHFVKSSDRYYELPKGMNVVRVIGIPQEFLVGRSLGPTPDEVRRLPLLQAGRNKSTEMGGETFAVVSILVSLVFSFLSSGKSVVLRQLNKPAIRAIGFITIACITQATLLILLTGYRMNARHLAFLFGPLFALALLPVAHSNSRMVKVAFVVPLLGLWTWSCANQILDPSYGTDDYRSAAKIIENDGHSVSQIVTLCHPKALRYYGIDEPLVYLREGREVACDTLITYLTDKTEPIWLVLSRPWNYPAFHSEELTDYFQVLREEHLPGIDIWLLILPSSK